ncbi:hypothetical protein ACHQM5_021020 [Ranunculus cassubicifolius]
MRENDTSPLKQRSNNTANLRLCNVSRFTSELLELKADNPSFHVLFIPGNPGVVSFYKEFVERVFEMLEGRASVTAIGHIGHTMKNWESGRLFSLQDQIDHKIDFIKQEIQTSEIPLLLVGHSIGSYISLEVFRRAPEQVKYCIGLYPFLTLNKDSLLQNLIGKIAASQLLSTILGSVVALLGFFPSYATRFFVRRSLGKSWSSTAVEALCSHLLKFHTVRNTLFMAKKEFEKFAEGPDWIFIRERQDQVAFLFGIDDHWGPLSLFEEISKEAPEVGLAIEREGHTHGFSCTVAGSVWVGDHVVGLIKQQFESKQY